MSSYEEIVDALGKGLKVVDGPDEVKNIQETGCQRYPYFITYILAWSGEWVARNQTEEYVKNVITIVQPPEEFWLRRYGEENFYPQKFKTKEECMEFTDRDIECVLFREVRDGE